MKAYLLALGVGLLMAAGPAVAADLVYQPQPAPEPYVTPAPVAANGWYLRGDVGYAFNIMGDAYYFNGGNYTPITDTHLDDTFTIGAGAGYQVTKHFRVDVTGDYSFDSDYAQTTFCGGGCTSTDTSKLKLLSLLANAYVDLGTWHGVTPYVGAGIGGTYVDWDHFDSASAGCGGCTTGGYDGTSDWRFTYALMAGASVDLTCNLKFDAGYRFRHVNGGATSGDIGFGNGRLFDKGIDIHEVRGGLRYTFGGCQPPQPVFTAYEPAPVYK